LEQPPIVQKPTLETQGITEKSRHNAKSTESAIQTVTKVVVNIQACMNGARCDPSGQVLAKLRGRYPHRHN